MSRTRLFLTAAPVLVLLALAARGPTGVLGPVAPPKVLPLLSNSAGKAAQATAAQGPFTMQVVAAQGLAPSGAGELPLELRVTSAATTAPHHAVQLALIIDRSGSMAGTKMESAKNAARALVNRLEPRDSLTLVTFDDTVRVDRIPTLDPAGKASALSLIEALGPGGGTNIGAALEAVSAQFASSTGVKRAVLISDGEPTVGITAPTDLVRLAAGVHAQGVSITALGVGTEFSGALLTQLSERAGGFYGYLRDAGQLEEILGKELFEARSLTARNVTLTVTSPGARVAVAGRHLSSEGNALDLPDQRPQTQAEIYSRVLFDSSHSAGSANVTAELRWVDVETGEAHLLTANLELPTSASAEALEGSRDQAVFARVVTAFGSEQLVAAAQAYEKGDEKLAFSLFDSARAMFGTSADALAGETEVMQRVHTSFKDGSGRDSANVRALERKKLSSFGMENAGY